MIAELLKTGLSAVAPYLVQILLGVIVALVIFGGVQTLRLVWVKKDLKVATAENVAASAKITAQNQEILRWQAEGERARQQAELAQQAAAKVRSESNRKIARLQVEQVPADCIEATRWAVGKAQEMAEGWQ